jgi:uncharacterized C2H2 Zn-finger protein
MGGSLAAPAQEEHIPMAETLVSSVKKLAREKRGLNEKERQVAHVERQVIAQLGRMLSGGGYRLVPVGSGELKVSPIAGTNSRAKAKRLRCPKCDRRFAHPLPMARHMSATHGANKGARKAMTRTTKK